MRGCVNPRKPFWAPAPLCMRLYLLRSGYFTESACFGSALRSGKSWKIRTLSTRFGLESPYHFQLRPPSMLAMLPYDVLACIASMLCVWPDK